jgi:phosphopantothenoylcysteine decarboxylase/phosphopantothenate--cysteine ligase
VVTVLTPGETADRPSIERWSKMGKDALAKRILVKLAAMRADGERR